jgi:hypothetical protein
MGLAAIRDVTAFLRREGGPANPLAADGQSGISRAIGLGISQSGRVLRDVLYYGMNEDEAGRLVFEAMMPIIPGARRSFTNDRFAEPGRNPGPSTGSIPCCVSPSPMPSPKMPSPAAATGCCSAAA